MGELILSRIRNISISRSTNTRNKWELDKICTYVMICTRDKMYKFATSLLFQKHVLNKKLILLKIEHMFIFLFMYQLGIKFTVLSIFSYFSYILLIFHINILSHLTIYYALILLQWKNCSNSLGFDDLIMEIWLQRTILFIFLFIISIFY